MTVEVDRVSTVMRLLSQGSRRNRPGPSPRRGDGGFTLIELLVVIVIIGILAAIAIPVFLGQRSKATAAQAKSDLRNLATAETAYFAESQTYLDTAAPTTDLTNYKTSGNVTSVTVETLNADGTKNGANGTGGFCATASTNDGKTYYYSTMSGGLTTTPCP